MTGPGIQSPLGAKPPPGSDRAIAEVANRSALKVFAVYFAILLVLTAVVLGIVFVVL